MNMQSFFLEQKRQQRILTKKRKLLLLLLLHRRRQRSLEKTRLWTKFEPEDRIRVGQYHGLLQELRLKDHETFVSFNRMTPSQFDTLLALIGPTIQKQTTQFREPISPGERLSITLRYLATGDSKKSISCSYMIGYSTTGRLIEETCQALWNVLQPVYLKTPTRKQLLKIASDYWKLYRFPNCIGPIDAKKVAVQVSPSTYKLQKICNIVMFLSCDSNFCFTFLDIEDHGKIHVSYNTTTISRMLDTRTLKIPKAATFPGEDKIIPFSFLGSMKLPLKEHMLKPYSERSLIENSRSAFNLQAERILRVLENAIGLLNSRWHVFKCQITGKPENAISVVKAACCLHNYLLTDDQNIEPNFKYCPLGYLDYEGENSFAVQGQWRSEIVSDSCFTNLPRMMGSNMYKRRASKVRDQLAQYFVTRAKMEESLTLQVEVPNIKTEPI